MIPGAILSRVNGTNTMIEWARVVAPIVAALIAGAIALWVSNRNVNTITTNATTSNTAATERERLSWIRAQTIERAVAVIEAADVLDAVTTATVAGLWQYAWERPGGHIDSRLAPTSSREKLIDSFISAYAELNRAVHLFQFVADAQPANVAELLRKDYERVRVQVRFLHQYAYDDNSSPLEIGANADSARDAVKIHQENTRVRRELLLHKVRESLGLAPIQLDAFSVTIPKTMSENPARTL